PPRSPLFPYTTLFRSFSPFHPVPDTAAVVSQVGVSQSAQQAHGLLGKGSRELRAVDGDLGGEIREDLTGSRFNLGERQAHRAGDVSPRIRLTRQHVHYRQRRVLQTLADILGRDLRDLCCFVL